MRADEKEYTWIQCQGCGHIHQITKKVSVEELFVEAMCPKCRCSKGLNCGDNINDIYLYMNPNLQKYY